MMVNWFEIPVLDMKRAKLFYEAIFDISITIQDFGGLQMGLFPNSSNQQGASGSLMKHEAYMPSKTQGALLYFSLTDMTNTLNLVTKAGGTILKMKTEIAPGQGFMALFVDTEGNRIGCRSQD